LLRVGWISDFTSGKWKIGFSLGAPCNAIAKWELGKYGSYGRDAQVPITRGG